MRADAVAWSSEVAGNRACRPLEGAAPAAVFATVEQRALAPVFTAIDFPLATSTTAFGINDSREIAGFYTDAGGNVHGFVFSGGAFSTVDVAGARGTQLTRIIDGGAVTGFCTDALNEQHGLLGR